MAERLSIGRRAVVYLIQRGTLTAQKLPGRTGSYVLRPSDVEEYLERRDRARDNRASA